MPGMSAVAAGRRTHYFQVPNHLDDDSDLDLYESRLLFHYRRVGGDFGVCWETNETTAARCDMSARQVTYKRKSLAAKGWISVELHRNRNRVRAIDHWEQRRDPISGLHGVHASIKKKTPVVKSNDGSGKSDSDSPTGLSSFPESSRARARVTGAEQDGSK